jgi:hypothetical protein
LTEKRRFSGSRFLKEEGGSLIFWNEEYLVLGVKLSYASENNLVITKKVLLVGNRHYS